MQFIKRIAMTYTIVEIGAVSIGPATWMLTRLKARPLYQLAAVITLHLEVFGKVLRCVEHRHNADVDQPFLAEHRIVADCDSSCSF